MPENENSIGGFETQDEDTDPKSILPENWQKRFANLQVLTHQIAKENDLEKRQQLLDEWNRLWEIHMKDLDQGDKNLDKIINKRENEQ